MKQLILLVLALLAWGILRGQVFLDEDFDQGIPSNWGISNGGTSTDTWMETTGGVAGQYLDGTEFLVANSELAGSGGVVLFEIIQSPVIALTGGVSLELEFDQYFRSAGGGEYGLVQVWNGFQWVTLYTVSSTTGSWNAPNKQTINISSYVNSQFRVRFTYYDVGTWGWYWAIDNVKISNPQPDVALTALVTPSENGRVGTSRELTSNEFLNFQIENLGVDIPGANLWVNVNGNQLGPYSTPALNSGDLDTFTIPALIDLSAVQAHEIEAYVSYPGDADLSNDTLFAVIHQWPNAPINLPWVEDFEGLADTLIEGHSVIGFPGLPALDFHTDQADGRLRTQAGIGFAQSGTKALTLDQSANGGADGFNEAILTYNLSYLDVTIHPVLLGCGVISHGEEPDLDDRIWIRGNDQDAWIEMVDWQSFAINDGVYYDIQGLRVTDSLVAYGQDFSSSFQIRIGQSDNFPANNLTANDGASFDNVSLKIEQAFDAELSEILQPLSGICGDSTGMVEVVLRNEGILPLTQATVYVDWSLSGGGSGTDSVIVSQVVAPGEEDTLVMGPINHYAGGTLDLHAYVEFSGDTTVFNDELFETVEVVGRPVVLAEDQVVCQGEDIWLAVDNPEADVVYRWYDDPLAGNAIAEADSFMIQSLGLDAIFFVEASRQLNGSIGPVDQQQGVGSSYSTYSDGITFDVFDPLTLDSLTIYPFGTGSVFVRLIDAFGVVQNQISTIVIGGNGGPVQIPINFSINPGNGYRLDAGGTNLTGLFRNSSGANYPYLISGGPMEITGAINQLSDSYYFFYDLKVSYQSCPSDRQPVQALTAFPALSQFTYEASGLTVGFEDSSIGNFLSYVWDFGDGSTSNSKKPTHTFPNDGVYSVSQIVANPCGGDTTTVQISVCAELEPEIGIVTNGLHAVFSDQSAGTATGWVWDFGDGGSSVIQNPIHFYDEDGVYEVKMIVSNACGDFDTTVYELAICTQMEAQFAVDPSGLTQTFTDQTSGEPLEWLWQFGDGNQSIIQAPTYTYSQSGWYEVCLTVDNLCEELDTHCDSIAVGFVSVDSRLNDRVRIWPNPASDHINVSLDLPLRESYDVQVRDLTGRMLFSQSFTPHSSSIALAIQVASWPSGVYLLRISTASGMDASVPFQIMN
ncbi:PKD domain-containing protein [Pontibacter sp. G13]|uniref:PKD domain-containing protein n=1 Tax=Pontibacter sp. G13 TaxID=3074898 RepID=UPI00288A9CC3|nr:PKD domain-containing protein [Pontibacter sp. G13]WNJ17940.1 PKD domain-containing protein [Pontibacter sp. G13]